MRKSWLALILCLLGASLGRASEISNSVNVSNCDSNVTLFGAKGDGTTDDTAAINRAIIAVSTGTLCFPTATYKLTGPLMMHVGLTLRGTYHLGSVGGTYLNQTASTSTFQMANSGSAIDENQASLIKGFFVNGGTYGIYAGNGAVYMNLEDLTFQSSFYGIFTRGFNQQWTVRKVEFLSCSYGLYLSSAGVASDGVTAGSPMLFDKNNFYDLYISGSLINGIYIVMNSGTANSTTFVDLMVNYSMQDGIILGGGMTEVNFVNLNTESNGYTGSAPLAPTTATTTAGNAQVIVGSVTGLTIGSTVTIAGAGTSGQDWYPYITKVFASSITVNATAPTSVTGAELVNYLYSDLKTIFANATAPTGINMVGPLIGHPSSVASLRYAIDGSGALYGNSLINPSLGRPVYDPSAVWGIQSGNYSNIFVRGASNLLSTTLLATNLGPVNCVNATRVNVGTTTLTSGTWEVSGSVAFNSLSAGTFTSYAIGTLSLFSGNTATDSVATYNDIYIAPPTTASLSTAVIPKFIVTASGPTVVYLKGFCQMSAGTPTLTGSIEATRVF